MSKEEINSYFDNYETYVIDYDPSKWVIWKNVDGEIVLKKIVEKKFEVIQKVYDDDTVFLLRSKPRGT